MRVQSPRPRLGYRIPFPEETTSLRVPPPLSSNFQASFARQMEAQTLKYYPDPHEIIIPPRNLSIPPQYSSPTIEELESLTLDSKPRCDMGDCIIDDVLACTMWDGLQSDLYNARVLEAIAREHHRRAAIEWERFKMRKFDVQMMGIIEREREVQKRFEEEGSAPPSNRRPKPDPSFSHSTPRIRTNAIACSDRCTPPYVSTTASSRSHSKSDPHRRQ